MRFPKAIQGRQSQYIPFSFSQMESKHMSESGGNPCNAVLSTLRKIKDYIRKHDRFRVTSHKYFLFVIASIKSVNCIHHNECRICSAECAKVNPEIAWKKQLDDAKKENWKHCKGFKICWVYVCWPMLECMHYITLFTQKYDANYMSASNKRRSSLFTVMPCNKTLTTRVTYYRTNPTPINAESNI